MVSDQLCALISNILINATAHNCAVTSTPLSKPVSGRDTWAGAELTTGSSQETGHRVRLRRRIRGDCVPIWWGKCSALICDDTETDHAPEQRDDWADIVNRAYREGRIGCKGLRPAELDMLLFSPTRRLRQVGAPHGAYLHANW